METPNSKYLLYGESPYDFGDHSPERMKEFNQKLKELLIQRERIRMKRKQHQPDKIGL